MPVPITDPLVIRFANESVRPLAEKMRNLEAEVSSILIGMAIDVQPLVVGAEAGALVDDGREAEGVSRLDREDIIAVGGILQQVIDVFELPANAAKMTAINKACVRPLRVTSGD